MGDGLLLTRPKPYFTRSSANACSFSYAEICCQQGGGITHAKCRRRGHQTGGAAIMFLDTTSVPPNEIIPPCRKNAQINTKSTLLATRLLNFTIVSILEGEMLFFGGTSYFLGGGAAAQLPPALCHPPPASPPPPLGNYSPPLPKRHKKFRYHDKNKHC